MSIAPPGHPAPPPLPERPTGAPPSGAGPGALGWSPKVALAGAVGIFLLASAFSVIPLLFDAPRDGDDAGPAATFFAVLIQDSVIVVAAWLIARTAVGRRPFAALGVRLTPFWRAVGFATAIMVCFLVLSAIWSGLVDAPEEQLLDDIGADETVLASVALCFGVCVMAPLAEETLFRGFMFGGLRRWGFWPAALISGALFGLAHASGPVEFLLPLAAFGFGLALLYELTKSIVPGIYLHAFNNCLAFSVGLDLRWEWILVFVGSFSAIALALAAARRVE